MSGTQQDPVVCELIDREAIRDCLVRATLGNDMLDAELWKSAYWPDAVEEHAWYHGNAHAFIDEAIAFFGKWDELWHQLGNILIRVDGDSARVQTYFFSYCRVREEGKPPYDLFAGGRYLDRMEKRGSEWRIAERLAKADWQRNTSDSFEWGKEVLGHVPNMGTRAPHDPAYAWFGDRLARRFNGVAAD